MAVRELIMKLALQRWERAKELGKQIQASVQKSTDLSRETRKEIVAGVRERVAAARLAFRDARRFNALGERAEALRGREAPSEAPRSLGGLAGIPGSSLVGRGRSINEALLAARSGDQPLGESLFREAGQFLPPLMREIHQLVVLALDASEKRLRAELDARAQRIVEQNRRDLETFEQRMRDDPRFAEEQAQRAFTMRKSEEKAMAAAGLSPAAESLDLLGVSEGY